MMATTEEDDEESFGDFTFAPSVVNSIPKANGSDLSFTNSNGKNDDDWGDFVKSAALSRSESLPTISFASDKPADPFGFFADQQNQTSQNNNSVPATEPDSAPSRIRSQFVKPKGALPLSLFGVVENEDDKEEGASAAGLLFNGATELKTNDKKIGSHLNVSDLISNLYNQSDQSKGSNSPKLDSKEFDLNFGNSSPHGLNSESNGFDLKRSVSNLNPNGLDLNGGVLNLDSNGLDFKRTVSNLDAKGLNWGLDEDDEWDFKEAEPKLPAGDLTIKFNDTMVANLFKQSENGPPILKAENGAISDLNGFNSSWNLFNSDLNGLSSNSNGNLDANKLSFLVDETDDFEEDDGWEFKVAESGSNSKVDSKGPHSPEGVKNTFGFGNDVVLPTDLFAASDGISEKSDELNFGDFSKSSATPNGINFNSFSDSKQKDDNKNGLTSMLVNGNVDNGANLWEFKDTFSETGSKDKMGKEVKLENHKGALPLSLFGDGEHETDNSLISQDALTANPAPTASDSAKKSPRSNISINDLISSLYSQAEQNTFVNPIQSPNEDHLGSTQKAVLVDDDGDFDDDSWEFKGSFSRSIGESQTSTPADGDSHIKYSTDMEQKEYADFYSRLKDELYVVARCHLDNLKKARGEASLCGEDVNAKALDKEIQDLSNEFHKDCIIAKEPQSENHLTSNISLNEFVEVLQEPKFHALESEYHLSKRLSLAEKDWRSAVELLKHAASTSKILTLGSKEEQCNYVSTWFKVLSACAQELRHGASIWKQSLEKNVHSQTISDPRGKLYVLALGEIYRSVEVLGSSAKFYKPWLLSYADPTGIFSLLRECSNLWSSSGLEEAFLSISDPIGFEYNATPKELLESVKYIHDIDVLALHNQVFSGQEPTCRLTLLPAGTVQGMKMVVWNGEHYFLTLANLWGNLISINPPNLPHVHVGS
ncbi:hypothetical protein CISIN_1g048300mg [Citrus sinensis]|uniref:Synergin gamma C-terminal domain-containing protein n=1 Tax=Citrus sinensis TaxID=2711 RepID=A0A067F042_CITSI|nr:hypothetical protein CISIN_1g048300mg [Citrus sinensis]